jgi:hypothetical protein
MSIGHDKRLIHKSSGVNWSQVTYFSTKVAGGLSFNPFNVSSVPCSISSSTLGLPTLAAAELPLVKAIPLENPLGDNGDSRLLCLSLSLLDGKYDIDDCRRPFLILLAPRGDSGPARCWPVPDTGESVLELFKAGKRDGEYDGEESTEPEIRWRGRGPGDIMFSECRFNLADAWEVENGDGVFSAIIK